MSLQSLQQQQDLIINPENQNENIKQLPKAKLNQIIVIWITMTLGVGVFYNPVRFAQLGVVQGFIYFLMAAMLTYYTFQIIFEAVFYTQKKTFIDIVESLLGQKFKKAMNITLIFDYSCSLIFYSIVICDLFNMLMEQFQLIPEDLDPYHPKRLLIRCAFCFFYYLVIVKLLFKNNMSSFGMISNMFLGSIILLMIILLINFVQNRFKLDYNNQNQFEYLGTILDEKNISSFFNILLAFNLQVYSIDLCNELENPTINWLTKINRISNVFVFVLNMIICLICYMTLGKENLNIIIYKYAFKTVQNIFMKRVILLGVAFLLVMTLFKLPIFNPSIRQIILETLNKTESKLYYNLFSVIPMVLVIALSICYPFIENIIAFFSVSIILFNGIIIPIAMKVQIQRAKKDKHYKIILNIVLVIVLVIFMFKTTFMEYDELKSAIDKNAKTN